MAHWDHTTDVLIVGSGSGGMTAALIAHDEGCNTLLIEKGNAYGGSTAMSGGAVWVPCNHLMEKAGIEDSTEEAFTYLKTITSGKVPDDRLRAYVENACEMLAYMEKNSHVQYDPMPGYSDYYPDVAGSKPNGGRSIEPSLFNGRKLGKLLKELHPLHSQARIFDKMMFTAAEGRILVDPSLRSRIKGMGIILRYLLNPMRSLARTDPHLTLGNALVGRLRMSLADRNIPIWLNTPAQRLIIENDRVVGLEAKKEGQNVRIQAKKGVILAAGGFEHSNEMREKYQRQPVSCSWSVGNKENTGDAIQMGIEAGAAISFMDDAWWLSITLIPGEKECGMIIVERSLPGMIIVNSKGKRFTNEAAPYIDVVKAQYECHQNDCDAIPAYLIMDHKFRTKYPVAKIMPGFTPKRLIESGFFKVSPNIEGLAEQCGIDPQGLSSEVKKFNQYAVTGKDLDFNKGDNAYDRYYGEQTCKPNPCLGPIENPPYYAIALYPGDLGTKGGLNADGHARVLREDGSPIQGLYAIGNCSSPVMGNTYGGAGGTIGPSMTFGYIAARHASGRLDAGK